MIYTATPLWSNATLTRAVLEALLHVALRLALALRLRSTARTIALLPDLAVRRVSFGFPCHFVQYLPVATDKHVFRLGIYTQGGRKEASHRVENCTVSLIIFYLYMRVSLRPNSSPIWCAAHDFQAFLLSVSYNTQFVTIGFSQDHFRVYHNILAT